MGYQKMVYGLADRFDHSDMWILNLFRISIFEFCLNRHFQSDAKYENEMNRNHSVSVSMRYCPFDSDTCNAVNWLKPD